MQINNKSPDDPLLISIDNAGPFSPGEYTVQLRVEDDRGESALCQAAVTVIDALPPVPDMELLPEVTGQCSALITSIPMATDNCGGGVTSGITAVSSNEAVNGPGDGDTAPDFFN